MSNFEITGNIIAYTDGSCSTKYKIGAWAAILFVNGKEIILQDLEKNTTNQRMELQAVLTVLQYIQNEKPDYSKMTIYTDSQYVVGIKGRIENFKRLEYKTKKAKPIRNEDLVRKLVYFIENMPVEFKKVKAHQKINNSKNYNRFVDKLCRKMVREYVAGNNGLLNFESH